VLAIAAFPFRYAWWGGWILAIAEAGIVGGLADWFAVTALFRRPLGLPIPHTALIPTNWELMASRVGTMVGSQVLTREYVSREISRLDFGELIARAAERLTRADLDAATRRVAEWIAEQLPALPAGDLGGLTRRLVAEWPIAPALATALDVGSVAPGAEGVGSTTVILDAAGIHRRDDGLQRGRGIGAVEPDPHRRGRL